MNDTLKLFIVAATFLLAYMLPIYFLGALGAFDRLDSTSSKEKLLLSIGVTFFIFSLAVSYIVGNLCENIPLKKSWACIRNGTKIIFSILWGLILIVLLGWLIYFLFNSMPLWAFVIAVLLFLNLIKTGIHNS